MNLLNQFKKVKASKANIQVWRNDFDSNEYKEASNLNKVLFGMALNKRKNCDCVDDLFLMINKFDNEKIKLKQIQMKSKFKLKPNVMIRLHGIDVITADNLTDEKAVYLLKKFPSHILSFEVFPEDWNKEEEVIVENDAVDFKPKSVGVPAEDKEEVIEEVIDVEKLVIKTPVKKTASKRSNKKRSAKSAK